MDEDHFSKLNNENIEKKNKEKPLRNYFLNFEDIIDEIDWKNVDKKYPRMIAKTIIDEKKYQ